MSNWIEYHWLEFDADNLPWTPKTETPVMPIGSDPQKRPEVPVFDPMHTYFAILNEYWGPHPVGSRVLITPDRVAIEMTVASGIGLELPGDLTLDNDDNFSSAFVGFSEDNTS